MSFPYRVTVSRTVQETVREKDQSKNKIDLTPILESGRMRDLLVDALKKKGFKEEADGTLTRTENGVTETFDPKTMEVTTTAEAAGEIKKEKTVEARGDSWRREEAEKSRKHVENEVGARLEKELAVTDAERGEKKRELAAEAAKRLADSEKKRMTDLNEATLDVYAEALKEKAKTLGEVKEVHENRKENGAGGTEYELVIKVGDDS